MMLQLSPTGSGIFCKHEIFRYGFSDRFHHVIADCAESCTV